MTVLPRLKPKQFDDLVVSISLIRPGPVQGNMVHPYLKRRVGAEAVTYPHPSVESALRETFGVLLFQEQVLKVARDFAGFTPGQGELLRRALGAKRGHEAIERLHDSFILGARARDIDAALAEQVFDSLRAFGGYSFPKSHAAAFAVLVYRSAWLKLYHPQPFYAALLNHQPMGFWSPSIIVNDAKRRGIPVLPVDICRSAGRCTVEGDGIRIGFNYVKGFGEAAIERLLAARERRAFVDFSPTCAGGTLLPKRLVQNLILGGALDGWGMRRELLWELGKIRYAADELALEFGDDGARFAPLTIEEALVLEHEVLGLSLREHPMTLYRDDLRQRGILDSAALRDCADGAQVRVAGLVVMHQSPPTAHGVHFITLEDEAGLMDVIVFPDIYAKFRRVLQGSRLLLVDGIMQQQDGVANVLAGSIQSLNCANL